MGLRIELHNVLVGILGSRNVYFQPPEGYKMMYPCIVYERDGIESDYAGNLPYAHRIRYSVTVIDRDPDSELPAKIAALPTSRHNSHFVNDNLHHDVFTIYY